MIYWHGKIDVTGMTRTGLVAEITRCTTMDKQEESASDQKEKGKANKFCLHSVAPRAESRVV